MTLGVTGAWGKTLLQALLAAAPWLGGCRSSSAGATDLADAHVTLPRAEAVTAVATASTPAALSSEGESHEGRLTRGFDDHASRGFEDRQRCLSLAATCSGRTECCSHTCEHGSCCHADARACRSDFECCSGVCNAGACRSCTAIGRACTRDRDCCSQRCDAGTCGAIPTPPAAFRSPRPAQRG
jgi:hypothetical protein